MASTKRRERKAPVKIVKEEVAHAKVEIDQKGEYLAPAHLLQLETVSRDVVNSKLEMALEEQALRSMILENALMSAKIEKQRVLVASKSNQYENTKKKFETLKKEVFSLHGFSEQEGLGYDVITGKIAK